MRRVFRSNTTIPYSAMLPSYKTMPTIITCPNPATTIRPTIYPAAITIMAMAARLCR
jgi:hypothetical protein